MEWVLAAHSLPQQSAILDSLTTAQVVFPIALCVIGTLLMSFGYKAYRWIVLLNFVGLGYWAGTMLGQRNQIGMVGAVVGAVLMGVAAMPLMKYAVATCGALVGAVIGMVIWAYCEQPLDMAWAGGLVGFAVLGMLSFVLFKTTVIVFTSIEGAGMFVFGVCALLMRYKPWAGQVAKNLDKPVLLPLLVIAVAAVALFWQHQRHGLIGHEGSPGGGGGKTGGGEAKKK